MGIKLKKRKFKEKNYRDLTKEEFWRLRKLPFDTYKPIHNLEPSKEYVVPLFVRMCKRFVFLGGILGFIASSFLITLKGIFTIKRKVSSFSRGKIIDLKYPNKTFK